MSVRHFAEHQRGTHDVLDVRAAFDLVAVENVRRCSAAQHEIEFPGNIGRVANS
ncbi:hypothetical protein BjapCC829_08115 [Bradyrhizobium barranii]|uniref:Uncharacterized protein n=1 Tax=Bradyrhizobium barranii TaxID=2992140 RepID=A0ABY3QR20_9BRAD|nr:hypothetical protein [Bradyrhizobium japonicum]UFW88457.1 hypothetical protein BjapCC829_08115 [Bradyrhizobium japonicum]